MDTFDNFSMASYAAIAGLFVGVVNKVIGKFLDKEKDEFEAHVTLRKELRDELDRVKVELYKFQAELDEWKEKYYHQVELANSLKHDVLILTDELTEYKRISGLHPLSDENTSHNGWFNMTTDEDV